MTDKISVSLGLTLNKGNFNSARLDATWETEVASDETVDEAFERAWNKVDEQVSKKAEEDDE